MYVHASNIDSHSNHRSYSFPLSPPSSQPSTALSSPYLHTLPSPTPEPIKSPPHSPLTPNSPTDDDDDNDDNGYMTERSSSIKLPRKSNRAPTLSAPSPSPILASFTSPSKNVRTRHRRSNSISSSSSASSPTLPEFNQSQPSRGRKVAATLQLFKETAVSPDDSKPGESSTRDTTSPHSRSGSYTPEGDVAEAQFEFVKRSEWPDREAAAVRRKSSTALERVRTRETVPINRDDDSRAKERKHTARDSPIRELSQWRKDINRQESGRGRRRERTADDFAVENEIVHAEIPASFLEPSPPRSRAYPPSPSPSRPPINRVSQPATTLLPENVPQIYKRATLTPIRTQSPGSRTSPSYLSPWSTDDESAWETGSAATSTTSTHHPLPSSHPLLPLIDTPNHANLPLLYTTSETGQTDTRLRTLTRSNSVDLDLDLPHIPLRPFRNQVGGHSAIYKFTKQAVCKVCSFISSSYFQLITIILASRFTGESLLRVRRA